MSSFSRVTSPGIRRAVDLNLVVLQPERFPELEKCQLLPLCRGPDLASLVRYRRDTVHRLHRGVRHEGAFVIRGDLLGRSLKSALRVSDVHRRHPWAVLERLPVLREESPTGEVGVGSGI